MCHLSKSDFDSCEPPRYPRLWPHFYCFRCTAEVYPDEIRNQLRCRKDTIPFLVESIRNILQTRDICGRSFFHDGVITLNIITIDWTLHFYSIFISNYYLNLVVRGFFFSKLLRFKSGWNNLIVSLGIEAMLQRSNLNFSTNNKCRNNVKFRLLLVILFGVYPSHVSNNFSDKKTQWELSIFFSCKRHLNGVKDLWVSDSREKVWSHRWVVV